MSEKTTITLCMIVKNEEHVIERCLSSVYKYIDRYDISDTGSTDKTKEIIKKFFDEKGIPGEVHDIPWEGFGKSRTQALRNCDGKADYAWMIDADDSLEGDFTQALDFIDKTLEIQETADAYALKGTIFFMLENITAARANWNRAVQMDPNIPIPSIPELETLIQEIRRGQ